MLVCTPTHRAAAVLRTKGIGAETLHSAALRPLFDPAYQAAVAWAISPGGTVPDLLVDKDLARIRALTRQHDAETILAAVGINAADHIVGYEPNSGAAAVAIIDEASMVGRELLDLCLEAFGQVVLIGDPGQLPPVNDEPVLADIDGAELTEIHRQAAGSAIIRLAHQVRAGGVLTDRLTGGNVAAVRAPHPAALRQYPLIVWRNRTRLAATAAVRSALGHDEPAAGEPLVCRSTDKAARAKGFYNNSLWRIITAHGRRLVLDQGDAPRCRTVTTHIEEIDGAEVPPGAVVFRFGYALTAHTAQGSEWERVYIDLRDYRALRGMAYHTGQPELARRWAYTAVTRASRQLVLARSLPTAEWVQPAA